MSLVINLPVMIYDECRRPDTENGCNETSDKEQGQEVNLSADRRPARRNECIRLKCAIPSNKNAHEYRENTCAQTRTLASPTAQARNDAGEIRSHEWCEQCASVWIEDVHVA
jgi:hypothetical protein